MTDKIEFHTTNSNLHNTWVMRITEDRRIEVNEDVEVTEAAQKVLEVVQCLLAQPEERNFCERCGKRLGQNDWDVHTCTPPQPEQEPVAWLHTKIEGVAVPHRPADLDKHPDRWDALYKEPKPCSTCEALSRSVMLDQTYYENKTKEGK